jgi:hypothetical protein
MSDEPSDAASTDVTPVTSEPPGERGPGVEVRPSVAARPLIGAVRLYQKVAAGHPSPCRHVPSCSTYAVEAFQIHGAVRGSWLAARRLSRCHPWGTQGYDPVPDRKAA